MMDIEKCAEKVRALAGGSKPEIAIVLGSGLGFFAERVENAVTVEYSEIPDFPTPVMSGHKGSFVFGKIRGVNVAIMRGRIHYYEGYTMEQVVAPIRTLCALGVKYVLLTNAAGGINETFVQGDLMCIDDHIMLAPNPMIGLASDFRDMTYAYSPKLRERLQRAAARRGVDLKNGVYAQLSGPSYETPAEIRALRIMGADAVGMSTACECVAANYCGAEVCAVSCITNMAAGITGQRLDHEEVKATSAAAAERFSALVEEFIADIE